MFGMQKLSQASNLTWVLAKNEDLTIYFIYQNRD
jgi:hypothetical protein